VKVVDFIKSALIAFGAALGVFLGRADGLLIALIVLCVTDYITGIVAAAIQHKLSSKQGAIGIAKKMFMFALVGVGNLIDVNALGGTAVLRSAIICFYIANEALSIIENAGELGLPIPTKLKQLMEQLRDKNDNVKGDDKDDNLHS